MTTNPANEPAFMGSILVVDDELAVRHSLSSWFRKDGYDVETAENASEALRRLQQRPFQVALLDIKMPGMDGMELLEHVRRLDPKLSVIMITAFASVETAVQSLKEGAFDYVTKPVDPDELSHLVCRALERRRLEEENVQLKQTIDEMVGAEAIVGSSPQMRKVLELVQHVAPTDATVLIRGESGTGKELVARAIHANSHRRYFPVVPVNCGALPETLLESELFGHERGAFTGAQFRRKGKLEMADGGSLFLDEVGAISAKMQVDLLRVLETKELTRVGGTRPLKVDFRVICATNEDLERAVEEGRFREDFYYRINVFTIEVPPLRARRADVPALAEHFVQRFARQMDKRITGIAPEAMELLVAHDWPGNVRELANAIERAMVVGRPPLIRPEDLPVTAPRGLPVTTDESLADLERRHVAAVLESTGWNVTRTAEVLQVDRVTVYNKIKKYGLRRQELAPGTRG
jgi:DNA-binding NtrC family response regulator